MTHQLPDLPYAYDALEPYIDKQTMEIHHDKHHQGYVNKLNTALEQATELQDKTVVELLKDLSAIPENIRQAVINSGGGHANHSLFWEIMAPNSGGEPTGDLATALNSACGSFENFKTKFTENSLKRFGSGWSWLVLDDTKSLQLYSTANQDSPLSKGHTPLLALDVWEHAYYLKYQNKRNEYVSQWWNIVNWTKVSELFASVS